MPRSNITEFYSLLVSTGHHNTHRYEVILVSVHYFSVNVQTDAHITTPNAVPYFATSLVHMVIKSIAIATQG